MPLESHDNSDSTNKEKAVDPSKKPLDAVDSALTRYAKGAILGAGLALATNSAVAAEPTKKEETVEVERAKADKVVMQKQQLDKEIAENAGVLEALRGKETLDRNTKPKVETKLSAAQIERAKADKVVMQKQQLDKEIAENAGVLEALRDKSTLESSLGTTGLNPSVMEGLPTIITEEKKKEK